MRAGIGLLSLLIGACAIFYFSFGGSHGGYVGTTLDAGKKGREQASQISGHDDGGVPVSESIKLEPVQNDGRLRRLKVVSVVTGGPFDTAYGLKAGDEIAEVGGLGVDMNDDFGLAEARVYEAIQRVEPLTFVRDGQKLTVAPKSALSDLNPQLFGKSTGRAAIPGAAVPSH